MQKEACLDIVHTVATYSKTPRRAARGAGSCIERRIVPLCFATCEHKQKQVIAAEFCIDAVVSLIQSVIKPVKLVMS